MNEKHAERMFEKLEGLTSKAAKMMLLQDIYAKGREQGIKECKIEAYKIAPIYVFSDSPPFKPETPYISYTEVNEALENLLTNQYYEDSLYAAGNEDCKNGTHLLETIGLNVGTCTVCGGIFKL